MPSGEAGCRAGRRREALSCPARVAWVSYALLRGTLCLGTAGNDGERVGPPRGPYNVTKLRTASDLATISTSEALIVHRSAPTGYRVTLSGSPESPDPPPAG